ncbi:MAG: hypothetical protein P8P74_08190 [Crocinitomicaceae bacterium]|nr:hypothetical protein [Crocinitomicaceae bacterium]
MKERIYKVEKVQITYLKSNPPKLAIVVEGVASSSGWTEIELRPLVTGPDKGIFQFELVGLPPKGISLPVLTPVQTTYIFDEIPPIFDGVIVFAKTNHILIRSERTDSNAANFEDAIPVPKIIRLKGISLKDNKLTLRVPSNGCTSKEDIKVDVNKGITGLPPFHVTVYRIHPDFCKMYIPQGVEITYTFEELGLQAGDWFSVQNQYQQ